MNLSEFLGSLFALFTFGVLSSSPDMDNRRRTTYPCRLNKGFSLKFLEGYPNQQASEVPMAKM